MLLNPWKGVACAIANDAIHVTQNAIAEFIAMGCCGSQKAQVANHSVHGY